MDRKNVISLISSVEYYSESIYHLLDQQEKSKSVPSYYELTYHVLSISSHAQRRVSIDLYDHWKGYYHHT